MDVSTTFIPYAKGRPAPASVRKTAQTTFCVRKSHKAFIQSLVGPEKDLTAGLQGILGVLAGRPLPAFVVPGVTSDEALKRLEDRAKAVLKILRRLIHDINAPARPPTDPATFQLAMNRRRELDAVRQELGDICATLVSLKRDLLGGYEPGFEELEAMAEKWAVAFNDNIATRNEDPKEKPRLGDSAINYLAGDAVIARLLTQARVAKTEPVVSELPRRLIVVSDVKPEADATERLQLSVRLFRFELRQINGFRRRHHLDNRSEAVRRMIDAVKATGCTPFVLRNRVASVGSFDRFLAVSNGIYSALEALESRLAMGVASPAHAAAVEDFAAWERVVQRHKHRVKHASFDVRRVRHVLMVAARLDTEFLVGRVAAWVARARDCRAKLKARGSIEEHWAEADEYLEQNGRVMRDRVLWQLFYAVGLTAISPDERSS